jgi:hypothetical protein
MNEKEIFKQKLAKEIYSENLKMVQRLEAGKKIKKRKIEELLINNYRGIQFFINYNMPETITPPMIEKPRIKKRGTYKDFKSA